MMDFAALCCTADGRVASNDPRPGPSTLLDSSWHMFTVTSQPGGGPGYLLYADGKLAAQVNATAPGTARDGSPLHVRCPPAARS
jgi:hypothetical protein